ncbi:MAG: tyrosine-type recombinase/integrase [Thermodesulfobacteriota bacterium]
MKRDMPLREPFQRGNRWYYELDRRRLSLRTDDEAVAWERFREIRKAYNRGEKDRLAGRSRQRSASLGQFEDEVLEWCREVLEHETWRAWRMSMRYLKDVAGASITLDQITVRHWDAVVVGMRKRGVKPSSINSFLLRLRSMFGKAVEWRYVQVNPFAGVRPLKTQKRPPAFIAPEDVPGFLASIECLDTRRIAAALIYTGRRQSELLSLTWDRVDFQANTYRAMLHKTKELREFPMHPMFRAVLESMPRGLGRIFTRWRLRNTVSVHIKAALRASGYGHLHAHDLRHTFASMVILAGNELKVAQELLGHASMKSTMIYAHLTPSAVTAGLSKVAGADIDFGGQNADRPALRRVK